MTRRARMGPIQTLGRGVDRMAPGGRRSASESPIRPFYRPVGEAGDAPAGPVSVTLRPTSLAGFIPAIAAHPDSSPTLTLVGGGSMSDQSDGSYARMSAESLGGSNNIYIGSVRATFETPTLGWEPSAATMVCRVRALIDTYPPGQDPGAVYWEFKSASGTLFARSSDYPPNTRWHPTSSWVDRPSDNWMTQIPSAADIAAGVRLEINATAWRFDPAYLQLDVADVWLTLEGTL